MRAIHFLSDLHLDPQRPQISDRFIAYLDGPARQAQAIYILGDLFEMWADDDISAPLYQREIAALKRVADDGVPVHFLPGNRDFLCGRRFAEQAGLEFSADPSPVCGLSHAVIMHGDSLCTDDRGYQLYRRIVRWPWLQALYRLLPRQTKLKIASKIRGSSKEMTRQKPDDILDVNEQTVQTFFEQNPSCTLLIHGHTHRPAEHEYEQGRHRLVLADWSDDFGEVVSVDKDGWSRHPL